MGEIKSTLDLVMEKTKNLTMSDKEKQAHKKLEFGNRIKGLIQKFQDGLLTRIQFKAEYEGLKKDADLQDDKLLVNEVFTRLDPDQDAQALLEILEECCGMQTATFYSIIDDYQKAIDQAAQERMLQLKEHLSQQYSITGSAVVPNLDTDDVWRQQKKDLQKQFNERLNQESVRLNDD